MIWYDESVLVAQVAYNTTDSPGTYTARHLPSPGVPVTLPRLLNLSLLETVMLHLKTFSLFALMVLWSVLVNHALQLERDVFQSLQKNFMIMNWARANLLCYSRSGRWAGFNSCDVTEQVCNTVMDNIQKFSSYDWYDRHWCSVLIEDKQQQQQQP